MLYEYMILELYKHGDTQEYFCKDIDEVRTYLNDKPMFRERVLVYELDFIHND